MCNKDKPWFDDLCKNAFGLEQEAHLRWTRDSSRVNWEEFVHCLVRANETYSEANRHFIARNKDVLMNARSPHKWWSTLKSAVFVFVMEFIPSCHANGICSALCEKCRGIPPRGVDLRASE